MTSVKKVAINGFGRIGRAFLRLSMKEKDVDVVSINDLNDIKTAEYLLKYDTAHGRYPYEVSSTGDSLVVNGNKIKWTMEKNPENIDWSSVDVVIESTGVFNSYEKSMVHINSGAKKVIITAPVKDDPVGVDGDTVLSGINSERTKTCSIVSNASCTTNAVGIPIDILDREIGVESAVLNTVHGYTSTQQLVDGRSKKSGNLRYGRAGAANIIPSSTGATIAVTKVVKSLENKFDGIALRVPVVSGSIADITFVAKRKTTVEEVNNILKKAASDGYRLFAVTDEQLVSSDIIGEEYVSIADLSLTRVVNNNLVKVMFWYDNEIGYSKSLIDQVINS